MGRTAAVSMRAAKPNLTHILHRRNAQITPEALLETADADVAASRKRGHCQRRMWLGLDDVDRGADGAGSNQFGLCRDDVAVWVIGGKQEPAHKAVHKRQPDQRSRQHTVGRNNCSVSMSNMLSQLAAAPVVVDMVGWKSICEVTCRPSASLRASSTTNDRS